jgi:hypothetical protein
MLRDKRLALELVKDALNGDKNAQSEIIDRADDKATQSIEHSRMIARTHEVDNPDQPETDEVLSQFSSAGEWTPGSPPVNRTAARDRVRLPTAAGPRGSCASARSRRASRRLTRRI